MRPMLEDSSLNCVLGTVRRTSWMLGLAAAMLALTTGSIAQQHKDPPRALRLLQLFDLACIATDAQLDVVRKVVLGRGGVEAPSPHCRG